jgi:hypothetical protein
VNQRHAKQQNAPHPDGAINLGSWTTLTNQPGVGLSTPMLLTDGTVMAQNPSTRDWYKLTPTNTGSYVNGTWTQIASLPAGDAPLYYASQVLRDGRVFIMGGEYNNNVEVDMNLGAVYDPILNTWTAVTAPAGLTLGDCQSIQFPDGTLMIADISNKETATCSPTDFSWTIHTNTTKDDRNDEEGWTLLPDGTILTCDAISAQATQRYLPTLDQWIAAGNTVDRLEDPSSQELGPMVLRYDGTVVAEGATGHIGIFTPPSVLANAGTWIAGPNFPDDGTMAHNQIGVEDGPACLMPNGSILMMASPITGDPRNDPFDPPATFYSFGTDNSLNSVPAAAGASGMPAFVGAMLLLPTGEVLFTSQGVGPVQIFTYSGGGPQDAWRPTISTSFGAVAASGDYVISGTQFNGFSQNSAYGDDLQNSTNYPLVRITNNATSHVFYCRTHDHSTMAVATGATSEFTNFTVPAGIETGDSTLEVVTNGIPSNTTFIQVGAPTLSLSFSSIGGGTSVTGTVTLTGNAPTGGATIAFGSDNGIVTAPNPITVPAGQTSTTFEIDTQTVGADSIANLTATYGAVTSSSVALTVKPQNINSVGFSAGSVVGGNNVSFTVTLSSNAPAGGTPVDFTCSSGLVIVPSSLIVPAGTSGATFTFATKGVAAQTTGVTVSASTWNAPQTATITINPASATSITFAAPSVVGGSVDTMTVNLNGAAPTGGESPGVTSNSPAAGVVGGNMFFASQAHQASVRVATSAVSSDTTVTLSVGGASSSLVVKAPTLTHFSIAPSSVIGGNPALLTVSLNGPAPTGGLTVSLNSSDPSVTTTSVVVPAGNTYVNAPIQTTGVTAVKVATITPTPSATAVTLTVNPPSVASIAGASSVTGGKPINLVTTLNVKASNSNGAVHLSSSNTGVATVSDVTVPNGSSSVVSAATTHPVTTSTSVTITASNSQNSQTFTFNVLPAALLSVNLAQSSVASGGGTFGVVYLTGPTASSRSFNLTSDDSSHVTLTPTSVNVGTGGTSASFTVKIKAGTAPEAVHITVTDPVTNQTVQVTLNVT